MLYVVAEAPPSCWVVLSPPDEQGSKVLMAKENSLFELDAFQAKSKVYFEVAQIFPVFIYCGSDIYVPGDFNVSYYHFFISHWLLSTKHHDRLFF